MRIIGRQCIRLGSLVMISIMINCAFVTVSLGTTVAASQNTISVSVPLKASFKSLNVVEGALQDGVHMAGGKIVFDPTDSYGSDGTIDSIVRYSWDFGNCKKVSTDQPNKYTIIYIEPEKYTVRLTITDEGGNTGSAFEELDLTLVPGDLILLRSGPPTSTLFSAAGLFYTHVGMYVGKINGVHMVIESLPSSLMKKGGVQLSTFEKWSAIQESYADVVRVNTDSSTKAKAINWAMSKLNSNYDVYSLPIIGDNSKQLDTADINAAYSSKKQCTSYYCSELIWAAYYRASNGAIDLSKPSLSDDAVIPDELFSNPLTSWVSAHHEHCPGIFR